MYRMTQPYQAIIDAHKEAGADCDYAMNDIVFKREMLLYSLENNRLLKRDRELLILLLELLTLSHD